MMVNRLIFEGGRQARGDELLFNHEHNGEPLCALQGEDQDGVDHLIDTLNEELKATDLGRLGVVLDADTDLAKQWARVRGCWTSTDAPGSGCANTDGTIVETTDGKKIGIWVMPDNSAGVEDFVGKLIAEGDTLWPKRPT